MSAPAPTSSPLHMLNMNTFLIGLSACRTGIVEDGQNLCQGVQHRSHCNCIFAGDQSHVTLKAGRRVHLRTRERSTNVMIVFSSTSDRMPNCVSPHSIAQKSAEGIRAMPSSQCARLLSMMFLFKKVALCGNLWRQNKFMVPKAIQKNCVYLVLIALEVAIFLKL